VPPVPGAGGGAEGPAAGDDGGAVWRAIRDAGAMREAGGATAPRGTAAFRSAASLASARLTLATLCCSPALGIMP